MHRVVADIWVSLYTCYPKLVVIIWGCMCISSYFLFHSLPQWGFLSRQSNQDVLTRTYLCQAWNQHLPLIPVSSTHCGGLIMASYFSGFDSLLKQTTMLCKSFHLMTLGLYSYLLFTLSVYLGNFIYGQPFLFRSGFFLRILLIVALPKNLSWCSRICRNVWHGGGGDDGGRKVSNDVY